jgi:hypothetical protein
MRIGAERNFLRDRAMNSFTAVKKAWFDVCIRYCIHLGAGTGIFNLITSELSRTNLWALLGAGIRIESWKK